MGDSLNLSAAVREQAAHADGDGDARRLRKLMEADGLTDAAHVALIAEGAATGQCHGPFLMSLVTAGHEIESEVGVCKNGEGVQRFCRLHEVGVCKNGEGVQRFCRLHEVGVCKNGEGVQRFRRLHRSLPPKPRFRFG